MSYSYEDTPKETCSEEIFKIVHCALIDRAHDKEPIICAQAIMAPGKLLSPNIGIDDQVEILNIVLDTLVHDITVYVLGVPLNFCL